MHMTGNEQKTTMHILIICNVTENAEGGISRSQFDDIRWHIYGTVDIASFSSPCYSQGSFQHNPKTTAYVPRVCYGNVSDINENDRQSHSTNAATQYPTRIREAVSKVQSYAAFSTTNASASQLVMYEQQKQKSLDGHPLASFQQQSTQYQSSLSGLQAPMSTGSTSMLNNARPRGRCLLTALPPRWAVI